MFKVLRKLGGVVGKIYARLLFPVQAGAIEAGLFAGRQVARASVATKVVVAGAGLGGMVALAGLGVLGVWILKKLWVHAKAATNKAAKVAGEISGINAKVRKTATILGVSKA